MRRKKKIKKEFQALKNGAVMKMIVYNNGLGPSNHLYRPITRDDFDKENIDLDEKNVTNINQLDNGDHIRRAVCF